MTTPTLIELVKVAATCLVLVSDSTKVKRAIDTARTKWIAGQPNRRELLIDFAMISISFGGPVHYAIMVAHDVANLM